MNPKTRIYSSASPPSKANDNTYLISRPNTPGPHSGIPAALAPRPRRRVPQKPQAPRRLPRNAKQQKKSSASPPSKTNDNTYLTSRPVTPEPHSGIPAALTPRPRRRVPQKPRAPRRLPRNAKQQKKSSASPPSKANDNTYLASQPNTPDPHSGTPATLAPRPRRRVPRKPQAPRRLPREHKKTGKNLPRHPFGGRRRLRSAPPRLHPAAGSVRVAPPVPGASYATCNGTSRVRPWRPRVLFLLFWSRAAPARSKNRRGVLKPR